MSLEKKEIFEFGDFRLDVDERTLERVDGRPCQGKLPEKAFQTLVLLLRRRGHLVAKDELLAAVWPDSVVEENNLDKQIHHLRRCLDKKSRGRRYIETVPKHGYRFVEQVRVVEVSSSWIPDSYRTTGRSSVSELAVSGHLRATNDKSADSKPQATPNDAPSSMKDESVSGPPSRPLRKWWVPATVLILVVASASAIWMLSKPAAKVPILDRRFSSDPLSTNGNVFAPAISPNGRHVAYISRHSNGQQSVWIRDLETGSNVEIVPATRDTYRAVAFSPDNSQVYFVRSPKPDQEGDLYRTAIFGGTPRKIVSGTDGHFSISPDGASISFVRCPLTADEYCSLWLAGSADGKDERRLVTRRVPFRIASNRFSPDGRSIAFAAGQSRNLANDFGLFSVSTAGGQEKPLTDERFFNIRGLVWLPTGQDLLIAASRVPNKTFRIWQVSVDGDVAGLTSDTQSYSDLSIDDSAMRLVAAVVSDDFAITVASRATGQALGTIDDGLQPTFGPSGKVYFRSARSGNDEIWCANTDGSQLLQLTTEPSTDQSPIASSDQIYFNSNRSGAMHVWRMAPDGTDAEQFTTNNGGIPFAISADSKWLYYHHAIDRTVWRIATDSRIEEKALDKQVRVFAVSRSARFIAFDETVNGKKSVVVNELVSSMDGGPPRIFELPDQDSRLIDAAWLPNEEALVIALEGTAYQDRLLQLQIIDGRIDAITLPAKLPIEHFDISSDDQLLAIAQGQWMHDAVLIYGLR